MSHEKPATTDTPIHDLLARRWSPRAFADRSVEPAKLRALFEAARWSPSCFNEQPWRYLVATKDQKEQWDCLFDCLVEANQKWAQGAPVLFLSVAKLRFTRNDKDNRHAQHDVGLATENLVVQAMALDLWVHQMAGFSVDRARENCKIPEGYEPMAMGAIGYMGDPDQLPEDLAERERQERERKDLGEILYGCNWGETASIVKE